MSAAESASYLEPTAEAGKLLMTRASSGSIVMLNLLRFRATADYSATPALAPPAPISGREAYRLYVGHTLPSLVRAGGELIFLGEGGPMLIGPSAERWDVAMLVRHRSVEAFLAFASDEEYLAGAGHRSAALEDSRLLPLSEVDATVAFGGQR